MEFYAKSGLQEHNNKERDWLRESVSFSMLVVIIFQEFLDLSQMIVLKLVLSY